MFQLYWWKWENQFLLLSCCAHSKFQGQTYPIYIIYQWYHDISIISSDCYIFHTIFFGQSLYPCQRCCRTIELDELVASSGLVLHSLHCDIRYAYKDLHHSAKWFCELQATLPLKLCTVNLSASTCQTLEEAIITYDWATLKTCRAPWCGSEHQILPTAICFKMRSCFAGECMYALAGMPICRSYMRLISMCVQMLQCLPTNFSCSSFHVADHHTPPLISFFMLKSPFGKFRWNLGNRGNYGNCWNIFIGFIWQIWLKMWKIL